METINKIKLTYHTSFLDGGTICYIGSDGNSYYEDHRIGTKTKGSLYSKYPREKDACMLDWNKFEKN